jgi:hypothetical protein
MMNPVTATNNKERFPCKSIDEGIFKFKAAWKILWKPTCKKKQVPISSKKDLINRSMLIIAFSVMNWFSLYCATKYTTIKLVRCFEMLLNWLFNHLVEKRLLRR